jgi:hypothetical protein
VNRFFWFGKSRSGARASRSQFSTGTPVMKNKVDKQDESLPPEEADQRRDEALRNMLRTKPKPHGEMKVRKRQDKD